MLVNKTVEFFLSEAAGWSGRSAGAGSGLGQNAGEGRGRDWDKIPAGAEAGTGTRYLREPRLSRQGANQLKRKRSIISSSNSGFSKSFSLVMIKLLCSKNPASW